MTILQKQVWALLALLLLIPAWFLAHQNTSFIESPVTVMKALPHFLADPGTWTNIGITLVRVISGLFLGVVAGFVTAFAMNKNCQRNTPGALA